MEVSVKFTADQGGIDRLTHDPLGPYGRYLLRMGNRAVTAAKSRANVDTGLMRSSIDFRVVTEGGTLVGFLGARTRYAQFVHDGTRYYRGNPFLTDAVRDVLR